MRTSFAPVILCALLQLPLPPAGRGEGEIGFVEKFALSPNREAVLTELIPGSEPYYFFHALHYQNTRQKAKLEAVLEQWRKRNRDSEQRRVIENREALLSYDADPKATLKFLRDRLHLEFNHQQEVRDQKPDLPSTLDQARIGREVFQRQALEEEGDLSRFTDAALEGLLRDKTPLKPAQIRALLARLKRPDAPNLVEVIAADLKTKESRGFGEFEIHRALLPEQLDDLAKHLPSLTDNQGFVFARLRKLAPGADAEFDPVEREAWLDRTWSCASRLSPAFNSLKANLLYQRLQHDRARGVYDEARFLAYLKLPRRANYMNPKYYDAPEQARFPVDLNANFTEAMTAAAPIHNDEPLVRDYFLHILPRLGAKLGDLDPADILKTWMPYVREAWLKPVLAEAMITNGIGEPERWASLLSPAAFQALKDRVDVEFVPTNPQFHAPADEVSLELLLKNVPKLIVKIYEINTLSYFLANQRQLNTDLQLDGLVANREVTHDFTNGEDGRNPFRRASRTFKFPELKGRRGAWMIEFIGGGKSSRALVRKGQWSLLRHAGPAGDMLTVLDETHEPVKGAVVWMDGRKFTPDEKSGFIMVPFTGQPGIKNAVLADAAGEFGCLASFEHHEESYTLDAQFHVEREQLLARREATLVVRTTLLLGEAPVSLELLQNPRLKITSTTLDGVATAQEIKVEKLDPAKDFAHTFTVPERLARLEVALTGEIEKLSKGAEKQELTATHTLELNGIDKTEATSDAHLSKFGNAYVFEMLGKNGEPIANQPIVFSFRRPAFVNPIDLELRTSDHGRVELGELSEIASVHAALPNGRTGEWRLLGSGHTQPSVIHAKAGDTITVPWTGGSAPEHVSLLEVRGDMFATNFRAAITGFPKGSWNADRRTNDPQLRLRPAPELTTFVISGLAPGDYSLLLGNEGEPIKIRVTEGKPVRNWLVSPNRELELHEVAALNIESVTRDGDDVVIQLANAGKFARVHLAATRFLPEVRLFDGLGHFARFEPGAGVPARLPSLFAAGREIGDEYRYILERRYSKSFAGNMLPRPGLILNPWEVRSTDLEGQQMAVMQQQAAVASGRAARQPAEARKEPLSGESAKMMMPMEAAGGNLDFLASSAPLLLNLTPDEKGIVRVPREALGDRQYVQVYAEDLSNAVWRSLSLPEAPTLLLDVRLARNLDPQKTFAEKKEATLLAAGETLTLADILTSDLETYDSLASVHALYTTLCKDPKLANFAWILQWPKLKEEEKLAKYSEFACHELNFFLARKDPAFFKKVSAPYLANKKDRTFMDDFLLGRDLRGYLAPWSFSRLNVAERCLMAQRVPGENTVTARHLRELWEILPPDPERHNFLFETALRGKSMQAALGEESGFVHAKAASEKEARLAGDLHPDNPAPMAAPAGRVDLAALKKSGAGVLTLSGASTYSGGTVLNAGTLGLKSSDAVKGGEESERVEQQTVEERAKSQKFDSLARDKAKDATNKENSLAYFGFADAQEAKRERALVRQFFRALGPTKEWAETNYYQLPIASQIAELITINAFWRDYAAWDGKSPFVSAHAAEASRNFSEMMLALAVLDLPFESPKHATKNDAGHYTLTAGGPLIAFHKEIKPAAPAKENAELLVSENFYRHGDRYRIEGNEKFDKYVTGEFLAGVVYGASVVVTNPTSAPQKLSVLLQIPEGALPVLGSKATDSKQLRLEPYTTQTFEYFFYFPTPRPLPYSHHPVNVSRDEQTLGAAKPTAFQVVRQLSKIDTKSWDYVSQYGTEEEVFAFLENNNLARLDLERVAWRARKSPEVFRKLISLLARRHVYNEALYSYAVVHNDAPALGEWLRHREDFIGQCGSWLDSKLIAIDPIERRTYQHLEYFPLVNQRIHRLGAEYRIPNPVLRAEYQSLLDILSHKPALAAMDQISVVYFLFLQDRIEEGLARYHAIQPGAGAAGRGTGILPVGPAGVPPAEQKRESLQTRLQYDYLQCYAAFFEERLADARGIANQYADYPIERWKKLFAGVSAQLDEIEGNAGAPGKPAGKPDREGQQSELASTEPSFDFKVENRQIALTWKNLQEVTINYYLMDPEFLFSASPFVTQESGRFSIIKPTRTVRQILPEGKEAMALPLPGEFEKANVLVEILGSGQRKAQTYHANTLNLTLAENYGRLELRDQIAGKPVSKAYVKVYARLRNGVIRFFKDGYTDLRGKFDYASLNSSESAALTETGRAASDAGENTNFQMLQPRELKSVEKLSILILSEAHGALVREVLPPAE